MQQTPSTQKPERQSRSSEQDEPCPSLPTQTPPVHLAVAAHWESFVHEVGQSGPVPLQVKRPQLGFCPDVPAGTFLQVPTEPVRLQRSQPPSHALLQQTPSTQWPDEHWLSAKQPAPRPSLGTQAPKNEALQ